MWKYFEKLFFTQFHVRLDDAQKKLDAIKKEVAILVGKPIEIEVDFKSIENETQLDETRKARLITWLVDFGAHSLVDPEKGLSQLKSIGNTDKLAIFKDKVNKIAITYDLLVPKTHVQLIEGTLTLKYGIKQDSGNMKNLCKHIAKVL